MTDPKPEDREAALQEACDLFNEPWDTNTIIPRVAAALAAARAPLQKRVEGHEAIFRWLLGEEGDFPERQPKQGAYYWRSALRKRLDDLQAPPCT